MDGFHRHPSYVSRRVQVRPFSEAAPWPTSGNRLAEWLFLVIIFMHHHHRNTTITQSTIIMEMRLLLEDRSCLIEYMVLAIVKV